MNNAVDITQHEGVVTILLNRPKAKNALNFEVSQAIANVMNEVEVSPDIRAVVVGSAVEGVFSAGADLVEASQGKPSYDMNGPNAAWGLAGLTAKTPRVPVIAAVDGLAMGGGFEIALAADIMVASDSAMFALPEVKVGLMAGAGGAVRLPGQLPQKIAMDMLLTGRNMKADEAHRLGLISRLVESGQALNVAQDIALTISKNAPLGVAGSKATLLNLQDGVEQAHVARWERNATEFAFVMASADAQEGTSAFSEKRAPVWSGC